MNAKKVKMGKVQVKSNMQRDAENSKFCFAILTLELEKTEKTMEKDCVRTSPAPLVWEFSPYNPIFSDCVPQLVYLNISAFNLAHKR